MAYAPKEKGDTLPWVISGVVVVISVAACSLAWIKAGEYRAELKKVRQDLQATVQVEKQKASADMEEKYRADRISYEVMARQMAEMSAREHPSGDKSK